MARPSPEVPMSLVVQKMVDDPRLLVDPKVQKEARKRAGELCNSKTLYENFDPRVVATKPRTCQSDLLTSVGVLESKT